MQTQIIVTDIIKKSAGKVGIAGYTKDYDSVRLVLPHPGIPESILMRRGELVIFPFAAVELNLQDQRPDPPFTENFTFDPFSLRFIHEEHNREEVLKWSLFQNVSEIFEQRIFTDTEFFIFIGDGPRSLGTIIPQRIHEINFDPVKADEGTWRMTFLDSENKTYRFKISDLIWHYYCRRLTTEGKTAQLIAKDLFDNLKKTQLYLRIGLERPDLETESRCFLEITGIYSFPNYLGNLSLSDLIRTSR